MTINNSDSAHDLPQAPLISHLTELRKRLIYIFIIFAIAFAGCFYFIEPIFITLLNPLKAALGEQVSVTYFAPHEAFFTYMNLSLYAALILSCPFLLLQIWGFIAPALYHSEKRAFIPFLIMTPVMFFIGCAFAFFIVMPTALSFFASFQHISIENSAQIIQETRVSDYANFTMSFIFIFGLAFQLPVALILAGFVGLISSDTLRKKRSYALMIIAISSAFFTPPDILSMFLLAFPLYIMYELSILCIRLFEKRSQND